MKNDQTEVKELLCELKAENARLHEMFREVQQHNKALRSKLLHRFIGIAASLCLMAIAIGIGYFLWWINSADLVRDERSFTVMSICVSFGAFASVFVLINNAMTQP